MRNEGMKDIGDKVHCWGSFGVVMGECQTKSQDGVGVIALSRNDFGYGRLRR